MSTISGSSSFLPPQLPPLDPPKPDLPLPSQQVNNGATDCFPDDMMQRLQVNQAGQDAGSQASGIIGDCTPEPDGGWPKLEGEDDIQIKPGDLELPGGGIQIDPGQFELPDIGFHRPAGIIDCLPEPTDGWPGLEGEATVREEIYLDDQGQIGTRTVVDPGKGDDSVQVTRNEDGSATVTVNGERHELTPEQARNMRVTGGAGNDTITVVDNRDALHPNYRFGTGTPTIEGGDGADRFEGNVKYVDLDNNVFEGDTVNGKPFR